MPSIVPGAPAPPGRRAGPPQGPKARRRRGCPASSIRGSARGTHGQDDGRRKMLRETLAERRPRAGRHRMGRGGRHAVTRTPLVSAGVVWRLPLVLAVSVLVAGVTGLG